MAFVISLDNSTRSIVITIRWSRNLLRLLYQLMNLVLSNVLPERAWEVPVKIEAALPEAGEATEFDFPFLGIGQETVV